MKSKTSLMSALALALTLATAVGAQGAIQNRRGDRPQGAQQDTSARRGPRGPRGPERMLLRGITLSPEQRTKLAELQRQERAAWEANGPQRPNGQRRQDGAAVRPRRERGDTTGFAARRAEMERRFDQRVAAIREILTPEQRTQFDRNLADAKAKRTKEERRVGRR